MKGKYIYGVIKTDKPVGFGTIGIGNPTSEVTTVGLNNLSAVISDSPWKVYQSVAKEETIRDLVTHQFVIEKVMEKFTIIPVKFGTMLESIDEVRKFLETGYFFLRNMLRQMEGKIELNVVVSWKMPQAAASVYRRSRLIKKTQAEIAALGDKVTLEDKIALGKLVDRALSAKKQTVSKLIARELKRQTIDFCPHDAVGENMIFNGAFLIDRQNEEFFNQALERLDKKLEDTLNFRLIGPLPPYSFATVVVERITPAQVAEAKKILGVNGDVTGKIVSQAYRKLAQEFHPDKLGGRDPLDFNLINSSYRLLKNFAERGFINVDTYRFERGYQ